ncbi:hypothetical protein LKE12_003996 [Salmonella enterica subsp. enterica serovar Amager]|nr:hypothetical protein [Salmonella enterica subsp. enterica serovar Glostrup]EIK6982734.1 hypothetical protein [Salmonella enterica subsp. enterica serovar Amager]
MAKKKTDMKIYTIKTGIPACILPLIRTLWRFFPLCLVVFRLLFPASAQAENKIPVEFNTWVESSTCTVSGLNQNVDLGSISREAILHSVQHGIYLAKLGGIRLQAGGCESTVAGIVSVTLNFESTDGIMSVKNHGTSGMSFLFSSSNDPGNITYYDTGVPVEYPLTGNSVEIPIYVYAFGSPESITTGTIDLSTLVTFDFR